VGVKGIEQYERKIYPLWNILQAALVSGTVLGAYSIEQNTRESLPSWDMCSLAVCENVDVICLEALL
jgi:hypothetical protein